MNWWWTGTSPAPTQLFHAELIITLYSKNHFTVYKTSTNHKYVTAYENQGSYHHIRPMWEQRL